MNTNCPKCGRPLREGAQFCTNCGARTIGGRGSLGDSVPTAEASGRVGAGATVIEKDALVGRVLDGKYEIVAPLGEGGMGAVYRARRVHIGDEVAVKVLHPRYVNDETLLERFRREARAAAQLHHPNVVTIHDYGEAGGREDFAYIVMELVRGESLRGLLLSEGKLPAARAVSLMRDVCAGVGAAHRRGIVHRDLKPDNIIVLPADDDHDRERVKVVDFGIAKLRDMASDSTLTQAGAVVGTPYYMSPEQCRGEPLDPRADVYSLGAVLYEMLAGAPPFTAPSVTGVIARHLTEAPPRLPEALGVPPALQHQVMRALAKDPEARQHDASDFAREIQRAVGDTPAEDSRPIVALPPTATPPPLGATGHQQQPAPVVPLRQPPTEPPRPPVPTAHGHTPTPTDPNQSAPGTHGQQQHTQGQQPRPQAPQQTHNQQPPHQQPAHQQPPQQQAAPPPRRKSRAPLVVGLVVLSLLVVSVLGIVGIVYLGSGGKGNRNAGTNANRAASRTNNNTATTSKSEITSADPRIAEAMRRAESKIVSDTRLTREDLAPLTPVELRLLRNALFARHGRVFQDAELRTYFESRRWYEPNNRFTEALLTETDRANAELIKSVEGGGGAPADDAPPPNAAEVNADIAVTVEAWAATTRAKLLDLHMIYYADTLDTYYRRSNVPASIVRADRARAFERYDKMDVQLSDVKITPDSTGKRATVTFDKTWEFDAADKTSTGSVRQQLTLTYVGGRWLITGEKDLQVHYSNSADDGAKN